MNFDSYCYLSDLAVVAKYQHQRLRKEIIEQIDNIIGDEVMLLLVAALEVMDYYPYIGFAAAKKAQIIH